tara:strand:+ start:240 stop:1769 length:1530 start_codon:yes stop_codon:yes gene_type:complete
MLVITAPQKVRATETTNILNNGSFDNQTNGWELNGNVDYDGNTYSGGISKSVRFSSAEGGSVTQSISLETIAEENQEVISISGSLISIGCNNSGSAWCTQFGTENNLDPVNITMTLSDGTTTEVLTHNFTSDYNDGTKTTNYSVDVSNIFQTNNTSLTVNYFGADTGNKNGQFGTIIDDLSVVLTLDDITPVEIPESSQITQIESPLAIIEEAPVVIIGGLDENSIVDTLSSGVLDIGPQQDMQIASLSPSISVISDIRAEQMHSDIADIGINNEMPIIVDTGVDVPVETDIPDMDLPEIDIDIEMPETLEELRNEEIPAELEETNMEEDLEGNNNEQQEETPAENDEDVGKNEESDISDDSGAEEKEEKQEENVEKQKNNIIKKSTVITKKDVKNEKSEEKSTSNSENKSNKNKSNSLPSTKIESDVVLQELDLVTVVSFNKEYFEVKITDTLDITKGEVDFYDGQDGFNNQDYAKANSAFFNQYSDTNSEWDLVAKPSVIKIDSFRR